VLELHGLQVAGVHLHALVDVLREVDDPHRAPSVEIST
jgi:hypothetical protein